MNQHLPPSKPPHQPNWLDDFDDLLWPVNSLLLLLSGCLAGVIVSSADFATSDPLKNGYVQLGILAVVVALLLAGAAFLSRPQQRRMQLAVMLSLIIHLALSVSMDRVRLTTDVDPLSVDSLYVAEEPVRIPDYEHNAPSDTVPTQIFDKPVEMKLSETETEPLIREAQSPLPVDRAESVEVKQTPQVQPQNVELARAETSVSRQSEKLMGPDRSRQAIEDRRPLEQVKVPVSSQSTQPTQQQPRLDPVQKQSQIAPTPQQPVNQPLVEHLAPRTVPRVERRAPQEEQPQNAPQLSSSKSASREQALAPVQAPTPTGSNAPSAQPNQSPTVSVARQANQAPSITRSDNAAANVQVTPTPMAAKNDLRPEISALASNDVTRRSVTPNVPSTTVTTPGTATLASANPSSLSPAAPGMSKAGGTNAANAPAGSSPQLGTYGAGSASAGIPQLSRATTSIVAGASGAGRESLASVTKATVGVGAAAPQIPITEGSLPDAAGAKAPAPLSVSGATGVGRSSAAGQSGTLVGPGAAPSIAGTPSVSVAQVGIGRATSGGEPPSPSEIGFSQGALVGRASSGSSVGQLASRVDLGDPLSGGSQVGSGTPGTSTGSSGAAMAGVGRTSPASTGTTSGLATPLSTGALAGTNTGPIGSTGVAIGPRRDIVTGASAGGATQASAGVSLGRSNLGGGTDRVPIGTVVDLPSPGNSTPTGGAPGKQSTSNAVEMPVINPRDGGGVAKLADRREVPIAAPSGIGGLGPSPAVDIGLPTRKAVREVDVVTTTTPRLMLEKTGGAPAIDAKVRDVAVPGLKQRDREGREAIARQRGGTEASEKAVELGLDFLARHQAADGHWSLHAFAAGRNYDDPAQGNMRSDTAATGMALLAFLGAGYTHTDGKYRAQVELALDYLVSRQRPSGDLYYRPDGSIEPSYLWYYSHGIASIALCEAYGMTRDRQLQRPAQLALDFIINSQEPQLGGWRYGPQFGSDTSVSGWQLMALKSGDLAGLNVPKATYQRVTRWLDYAQGAGGNPARYAYRPASEQPDQREPSQVMTAEALLMRQYMGWKRETPSMIDGADWFRTLLPSYGQPTAARPWGDRDAYYWYYATQVMFQMQGDHWRDWNQSLRELLVSSQEQQGPLAGSWHPHQPVPDRWGSEAGRIYVTCLHLLMLEVYYRHLPIYQTLDADMQTEPKP